MKILYILENYYPFVGGVETLFQNVCEGMVKRGHEVSVVYGDYGYGSRVNSKLGLPIQHNGVELNEIPIANRYEFPFLSLFKVIQLARISDVIHTSTYTGAFPTWVASKIWHKPCVITVHEALGDRWKKFGFKHAWLLELLEKIILKLGFDKYISVSQSTQRQLERMGIESEVIYNGIDYGHWNPDKYEPIRLNDGFTYLYFGRAGITKGLENLIKASMIVSKTIPNSKLVMILGKEVAEYRKKIVEMVKDDEHIRIMDSVPYNELPCYIKGADCVAVPSLSEGFGFSCAEACAMGVPVVATNVDSLPEVVSNKYLIVESEAQALAEGILKVTQGEYRKEELKKFTWDRNIQEHESLYRSLL